MLGKTLQRKRAARSGGQATAKRTGARRGSPSGRRTSTGSASAGQSRARQAARRPTRRVARTPAAQPSLAPIVIGLDFSDASFRAMEAGVRLARQLGTSLVLVHATTVVDTPGLLTAPALGAPGLDVSHPGTVTDAWIQPAPQAATWAARVRAHGLEAQTVERPGRPAELIVDEARARGAQLIVVGSRGRTGLKEFVLGSVAQHVVAHAPCPVLVVPATSTSAQDFAAPEGDQVSGA